MSTAEIKEKLHVVPSDDEQNPWILVIYGLGKSQLALNFVHTCPDYTSMSWIEAEQKETIKRDYLSMYRVRDVL